MALPELNRTINDDFVNTWYEIRPEVIDNILTSTVLLLALKENGVFTPQVGGEYITRTIGYGTKSTQAFVKGTIFTQEVVPLDTMGRWDWRFFGVDVNKTMIDDHKNEGKFRIKSYIARRIEAAKDALSQDIETDLFRWGKYTAGTGTDPYRPNGLYDIAAPYTAESAVGAGSASDTYASGTNNGNINRTNSWYRNWAANSGSSESIGNKVGPATSSPFALNLVPQLRHFYNLVNANQEPANFIIMDQDIYEAYEDEVGDKQQIVRTSFDRKAADLGFETFTFKGAAMAYSAKLASTKHIFILNLNHLEYVFNPNMWFDMTNWKDTPNQLEQVAYIVCMTSGLITDQPRRHGHMEYAG